MVPRWGWFSVSATGVLTYVEGITWANWIFRLGSSLELNGGERQNSNRIRANINANRTTERW
jgi:hypothetical protein